MISTKLEHFSGAASISDWITPRRIRVHATILALCIWAVAGVDFATPGLFDRAGNIKFQDFLPFYVSARLLTEHRSAELYDQHSMAEELKTVLQRPGNVRLPYLYGPQVALFFSPGARLSFLNAAAIWAAISILIFFGCVFLIWKSCPTLRQYPGTVLLAALAFPPLFHFFVRGQISALVLACFTAAFLCFERRHDWLAGIMLGFLIFKPQFLVAIPLVLLLARAWKPFTALVLSAAAQLLFALLYCGQGLMRSYISTLLHPGGWITSAELPLAPIQMHSLRSFWSLLVPWPTAALALYVLTSIAVLVIAAFIFRSSALVTFRFSALTFSAVLVNPHLFVYDLLVLAPALLLLAEWSLRHAQQSSRAMRLLLYLAFVLPLFGPLSRWTHLQLSVAVFAAILWTLGKMSSTEIASA